MNNSGFTLIELLIVVSIFAVLAAISVPVYGNWQSAVQIDTATSEIVQALRQTKNRSEAGYNNSAHGVYFEVNPDASDRFIIYQGGSYATRDSNYDLAAELAGGLALDVDLADTQVNFSKGLGEPGATGTVMISHSTTGETKNIILNDLGVIE